MNIYNDYRQRLIIDMIRIGNLRLREEFFWYTYNKIIKTLKKYNIPSDIFPDIESEVAISILDTIDNYDFSKITSVAVTIRQRAFNAVIDYLYNIYDYKKEFNGKVYKNVLTYLNACNKYNPSPSIVLGELLRFGKRKIDIIEDITTAEDYMEDYTTNKMISDRYFEIMKNEHPNYQTIMLGKLPINPSYALSDDDIRQDTGYSKANIYLVIKKIKEDLGLDDELSTLLNVSKEQKLQLLKNKYNRSIK